MRVLGIDPGVSETGWAVLEDGPALLGSGILRTAAGLPLPDRLLAIHEGLSRVLRESRPDAVAEEMF